MKPAADATLGEPLAPQAPAPKAQDQHAGLCLVILTGLSGALIGFALVNLCFYVLSATIDIGDDDSRNINAILLGLIGAPMGMAAALNLVWREDLRRTRARRTLAVIAGLSAAIIVLMALSTLSGANAS
jgi:uncharacterized membrane protein YeaQ/YmgE (transglycosylase-associated protein family)